MEVAAIEQAAALVAGAERIVVFTGRPVATAPMTAELERRGQLRAVVDNDPGKLERLDDLDDAYDLDDLLELIDYAEFVSADCDLLVVFGTWLGGSLEAAKRAGAAVIAVIDGADRADVWDDQRFDLVLRGPNESIASALVAAST